MSMRIFLNLLPLEKREALTRRFYSRFFLWQTSLVLLLAVMYTGVLGGIYILLHYQTESAQATLTNINQAEGEMKRLVHYQDVFKTLNAKTDETNRYLDKHFHWNNLFAMLDKITPSGVSLIELTTKDYTISIAGTAATREQFLQFENALKQSDCTSDVKTPLSNLFSQTEVSFQMDFNFKSRCLIELHPKL